MTLTEILFVIAIIGLLAFFTTVVLKKGVESANRAKCLGNLRQIGLAAEHYTRENNNTFPDINAWPAQLSAYLLLQTQNIYALPIGTKTVYWCPASTVPNEPTAYSGANQYGINAQGYAGLKRFQVTAGDGSPPVDSKRFAFMDSTGKNVWDSTPGRISSRHGSDNYNVVFADGHAENMTSQQYPLGSSGWRNLFWGYKRY